MKESKKYYPALFVGFIVGIVLGAVLLIATTISDLEEENKRHVDNYKQLQMEYKAKSVESYEQSLVIEGLNYEIEQNKDSISTYKEKVSELTKKVELLAKENSRISDLERENANLKAEVSKLKK